jgi:hypothetical protein
MYYIPLVTWILWLIQYPGCKDGENKFSRHKGLQHPEKLFKILFNCPTENPNVFGRTDLDVDLSKLNYCKQIAVLYGKISDIYYIKFWSSTGFVQKSFGSATPDWKSNLEICVPVYDIQVWGGRHVGLKADVAELWLWRDVNCHILTQTRVTRILHIK